MNGPIEKIISGGQTGADRAALDWAIANNVDHGGWCPKGRKAVDGPIDHRYELKETPTSDYLQRTKWNVRDSDGPVIFTLDEALSEGAMKTSEYAEKFEKPWIHLTWADGAGAAQMLRSFILEHKIRVLNVAFPSSKEA